MSNIISFDQFKKKKDEIEKYRKSILKLIDEFILLNINEFIELSKSFEDYEKSIDFLLYDDYFKLKFYSGGYREYSTRFSDNLYYKLKNFMKDPEFYRNINKYKL